ncbi:MAG: hypothetical protein EAX96_19240 [Candidatus Lokiarchaeota archaeon]|nr:hypothetical protein [Candidatus Lokiarchaeota archaeon]
MIFIFIILIIIAFIFFIGPYQYLIQKVFDDNDQVGSKLTLSNDRGKGFFNEVEEIYIPLGSDKIGYNLILRISVDTDTEDVKLLVIYKNNYLNWNSSAQNITLLQPLSIFNYTFLKGNKTELDLTPYLVPLIPNEFYFVFTNLTPLSGDYNIDDVDITLHISLFRTFDFIYGIILIIIASGILIIPLWIERKIKKRKENVKTAKQTRYEETTTPQVTVEKSVQLKRQYEYYGGFIRVKLKVENNTNHVISDAKCMFDIPNSFKLMSIQPHYNMMGDTIILQTIQPLSGKTIALTLEPLICGDEKLHASIRYLDNLGNQQFVSMDELVTKVTCPLFFTEEEANIARLRNLKERVLDKKDERSYSIPEGLDLQKTVTIMKEIIGMHDIRLVFEDIKTSPSFIANIWYFGRTKVKKNEFVIEGTVSEQKNSVKIAVACSNTDQLVGLLAEIGSNLRKKILETGIIRNEGELKALRCPSCAGPLDHYPRHGETVRCPWCEFLIISD